MKTQAALALVATILAALIGAASASAAKFTAGKSGAKIVESTLVQTVFGVTGSKMQCNEITYTGTTEGTEYTNQKLVPSYGGCTAFGFTATITNSGCTYNWSAAATASVEGASCTLTVQVNNVFAKCKALVKSQTGVTGFSWSEGSGDLVGKANVSNIVDEVTESWGLCPLTVGKHANGSITGESTVGAEGTTIGWDA